MFTVMFIVSLIGGIAISWLGWFSHGDIDGW
jgi:hypothetical protein